MNFITKKSIFRPDHFVLQWHITDRCNWYCRHCYQANNRYDELPLKDLIKIFGQYLKLIRSIGMVDYHKTQLSISGGEPLLRKDFFLFLEKIVKYNRYFHFIVMTNGSLINKETALRLKQLGAGSVQVSLEGMEKINDFIRGKNAFQKTIAAIKILVQSNIKTNVSLTLSKDNLSDIPGLIDLCDKLGVWRLGLRRLVPIGNAKAWEGKLLSPAELRKFYFYIEKQQKTFTRNKKILKLGRGCEEGVLCQEIKKPLGACAVLEGRVLVVLANGDVVPCRRLPIKIGNVLKDDLRKIYYTSPVLERLRNLNNANALCKNCRDFNRCLSGAKCVSYAYFNTLSAPDPQCWKLFRNLPKQNAFRNEKEVISNKQRIAPFLFRSIFREIKSETH